MVKLRAAFVTKRARHDLALRTVELNPDAGERRGLRSAYGSETIDHPSPRRHPEHQAEDHAQRRGRL